LRQAVLARLAGHLAGARAARPGQPGFRPAAGPGRGRAAGYLVRGARVPAGGDRLHRPSVPGAAALFHTVASVAGGGRAAAQRSHRHPDAAQLFHADIAGCPVLAAGAGRHAAVAAAGDRAGRSSPAPARAWRRMRDRGRRAPVKDGVGEAMVFRGRVIQGLVLVAIALLCLVARYGWLQLVRHEEFATRSESNRIKPRSVAPARGLIYDRNGVLLADNRPAFRLEVIPEQVKDIEATLDALGALIALDPDDTGRFLEQYRT